MAIIKCTECGANASTTAKACPACGATKFKPTSKLHLLFAGALLVFVVKCTYDSTDPNRSTSTYTPPPVNPKHAAAAGQVKALRELTKDPSSFELVQVILQTDQTTCVTYRGKNSFNAKVLEQTAFTPEGKVLPFAKACTSGGTDITEFVKMRL